MLSQQLILLITDEQLDKTTWYQRTSKLPVYGGGAGVSLAPSAQARFSFLRQGPGVCFSRNFLFLFITFENHGEGVIPTEVLRTYQTLAGREVAFTSSDPGRREGGREGRKDGAKSTNGSGECVRHKD